MSFALLLVELAASYALNQLSQPNGPRVTNLSAGLGDYGLAKPVLFGEQYRVAGLVIAQADLKETVHKHHNDVLNVLTLGLAGALLPARKTYTYSDTLALLVADRTYDEPIEDLVKLYGGGKLLFNNTESAVVSESLDGDGRLISRKYGSNKYCKSVTIYGGGFEQTADPIIAAALGNTQPGYRGTAYVVIEDLQLKDFGNAVPVPIDALVKVKTGETLASVVETVCNAAGMDVPHNVSTTAFTSDVVRGYGLVDEANCWDAIQPLLPVFAADAAEVAGQIRFYKRDKALRASIPPDDMGAYVYGDEPPAKFTFSRQPDHDLPKETTLTFVDATRDYQPNTAKSQRSEGNAKSNVNANVPVVLTADEAANAVALMHWDAWLGRMLGKFTLTDTWIGLEVGRAYAITIGEASVPYRITRRTRGANGINEVEAVSDEAIAYSPGVTGTSGNPVDPGSTLVSDTVIIPIDGSILLDSDDEYGFYFVMAGSDASWSSGTLQVSLDGTDYTDAIESSDSAIVGDVTGTLAAGPTDGLDDTLDTTTVLTVDLLHSGMTLESATDDELDAGKNMSWVGKDGTGEWLQFKTATFISGTTWELTDLRRGRKGSDWAIAAHVADEQFALVTEGAAIRLPASTPDNWGVPLFLRGVTFNQDEADADVIDFTNTGEGKRPYSPVNVMGSWDGSNNLTITWDSRSRLNAGGLGIDDQNNFEVEITTGAGRTITATGVSSADYSAADQTTDTITPGDSITGRVRQLSDVNDGRWRDFFLAGPGATLLHEEDDSTPLHLEDGITPFELG